MTTLMSAAPAETRLPAGRVDLYAPIHKALRLFMADTLARLGRTEPGDPAGLGAALDQLEELLAFCLLHLSHENAWAHPAIEAVRPGVSRHAEHEHAGHIDAVATLAAEAATLRAQPTPAALHRLYRHLALFIADNLQHMDTEEVVHNAALWAAYDDAELLAIEARLMASIPADALAIGLRWLQAALPPSALASKGLAA